MERGTADEIDASMLGTRLPPAPASVRALRMGELLLHLVAWAGVIAGIILDAHADSFDPSIVIGEVRHYSWRKTSVDAALAAFVAVAVSAVAALNAHPAIGAVISAALCGGCIAKRVTLEDATHGGLRLWCVISAVTATGCVLAATLIQSIRTRRRRTLEVRFGDDFDGDLHAHSTYTRSRHAGTGASVRRLLGLGVPERCMITIGTIALLGSTTSQMLMPALVGQLMNSVITPDDHHPLTALARVTLQLIAIFGVGAFFSFWRGYLFTLAGERVVARLRKGLFTHILSLEVGRATPLHFPHHE